MSVNEAGIVFIPNVGSYRAETGQGGWQVGHVRQQGSHGQVFFGAGCLEQLRTLFSPSDKVLVITDPGVRKAGITERVCEALPGQGVAYVVFEGVKPEAPPDCIASAAQAYRSQGCSALLAVGGGSVMDVAKAAGVLLSNPGDLASYYGVGKVKEPIPPLVAVPTTAGTGSEMSDAAVINDHLRQVKAVIRGGPLMQAKAIFLEPGNMAGIPPAVAAESGADALSHAMEALASKGCQPFARGAALEAIRLIFDNLEPLVADSCNENAATNMLIASSLAGHAFTNAGLGLAHGLAHSLGARFHVGHGKACALYLPMVMRFNAESAANPYRLAAMAMDLGVSRMSSQGAAERAVAEVEELLARVGLPRTYRDMGVNFVFEAGLVEEVMAMPAHHVNPRVASAQEIQGLFMAPA
ncbi:MAG: iron-containing alcohol dehydrogenase [Desulfovibrio sp.]|nr:iron-containing alcohol dehydrogenase [Desulfovibrio sp.]